jgi:hypothetical protein
MDLRETGLGGVNWIQLVAGCCECGDEPPDSFATELVLSRSIFHVLHISRPSYDSVFKKFETSI